MSRQGALETAAESILALLESDPPEDAGPRLSALSRRCAALCSATRSAPAAERYRLTPESASGRRPVEDLVVPIEQRDRVGSDDTARSSTSVAPIDLEAGAPRAGKLQGLARAASGDEEHLASQFVARYERAAKRPRAAADDADDEPAPGELEPAAAGGGWLDDGETIVVKFRRGGEPGA